MKLQDVLVERKRTQPYRYGVPAKYLAGLSDDDAKKRAAEIKRRSKKADTDGDTRDIEGKVKSGAKDDTKDSPSTRWFHKKYGKPESKKEK